MKNSELQKIKNFAFKACRIISIVIPPEVTEINNAAFQYCYQVVIEIDENSKLRSLGEETFFDVVSTTVFIPHNLQNILS